MAIKDLREYISTLEREGELRHVTEEVDWNLEVGAIVRRCNDLGAPAPLFENIKGYPQGFRVLGTPVGPSSRKGRFYARIALSLGLPSNTTAGELIEHFVRGKDLAPIPPKLVSTGPCKENIQLGEAIDLLKFPVPYIHQHDGGRYIGSWHIVVTKDPDSAWVNWGLYRLMVHDGKSMGGLVIPTQHIGQHFAKYEARNQPMPFAVAIGTEPSAPLLASAAVPDGVDESGVIGAFRGEPVEVVKCETVPLEVPAHSEIVIEGHLLPHERKYEGPFGEYTGYQARAGDLRPIYQVTAVTHRNDPIIPAVSAGTPVEDHVCMSIVLAADLLHLLREADLPVGQVFIPPTASLHLAIISVTAKPRNIVRKIADTIWASKNGIMVPKLMIVDDDVDATDVNQVLWAFCTRNHPGTGIRKVPNSVPFPLWAFPSLEEKQKRSTTKAVFDCTWPTDWPEEHIPRKASLDALWPAEVRQKVLDKWTQYGYDSE